MIGILDYGLGNIQAFVNVYKNLDVPVQVINKSSSLSEITKLILPGVGAFDHAMRSFNASGLRDGVENLVLNDNVPILGVCVGMQMLADASDEGTESGLGWVSGRVVALADLLDSKRFPTPHMGWNDVMPIPNCSLFRGFSNDVMFYFLHSYFFECSENKHAIATVDYGMDFCCAVANRNIYGVQFHPEKSHHYGVQLLKNFAEL